VSLVRSGTGFICMWKSERSDNDDCDELDEEIQSTDYNSSNRKEVKSSLSDSRPRPSW
jgi:hypothetical protein